MSQVIIFQNPEGPNVCVSYPVELSVEDLIGGIPGGIIVDRTELPSDQWFDAFRLVNGSVVVDLSAAKEIAHERLNASAVESSQKRNSNVAIGLSNAVSDIDWIASVNVKRALIDASESVGELSGVVLSV